MSDSTKTNLEDFLSEQGAGIVKGVLEAALSKAALGTCLNGHTGRKGKVDISFAMTRVGEDDQVLITTKMKLTEPTKKGNKVEDMSYETLMYANKGGKLTMKPETPADSFGLSQEQDGVGRKVSSIR